MPVKYNQDTKAKAIPLVREHAGDYPSEYAAIRKGSDLLDAGQWSGTARSQTAQSGGSRAPSSGPLARSTPACSGIATGSAARLTTHNTPRAPPQTRTPAR